MGYVTTATHKKVGMKTYRRAPKRVEPPFHITQVAWYEREVPRDSINVSATIVIDRAITIASGDVLRVDQIGDLDVVIMKCTRTQRSHGTVPSIYYEYDIEGFILKEEFIEKDDSVCAEENYIPDHKAHIEECEELDRA